MDFIIPVDLWFVVSLFLFSFILGTNFGSSSRDC